MTSTERMRNNYLPQSDIRGQSKQTKSDIIKVGSIDYSMFFCVILLVLIGVVMVFSASYSGVETGGDIFYYLKRQALFAVVGVCGMVFMAFVNYRYLRRIAIPIYIASNVLLVLVILIGPKIGGARRWLPVPVIGRFQPSEIAKLGVILMISLMIYANKDILKKWSGFFVCCVTVGITVLLVALGNLSTAIIIAVIGFGIIFIASPYTMLFIIAAIAGVSALVSYLAFFADGFRGGRFKAWLDPFADASDYGYQAIQSLYAIASGGWFGLGLGQSRQKTFIPEAHNDIIFSIICEELGLAGAAIVILLFSVLIWRGIKIAINAPDLFGSLVATGIVITVASQVIINIAVVTNSIPNTGVPLPFISSGGTALVMMMGMMGILLNISRYSKE